MGKRSNFEYLRSFKWGIWIGLDLVTDYVYVYKFIILNKTMLESSADMVHYAQNRRKSLSNERPIRGLSGP